MVYKSGEFCLVAIARTTVLVPSRAVKSLQIPIEDQATDFEIGHQGRILSYGHQGDTPYCIFVYILYSFCVNFSSFMRIPEVSVRRKSSSFWVR